MKAQDLRPRIDQYMDAQVAVNHFSGTVLVARGSTVLVSKGYGMGRIILTPESKFPIGVIAEQFTAAAVLQLAESGKLEAESCVCTYIPSCPDEWKEIKMLHLLTHTSGLQNADWVQDGDNNYAPRVPIKELIARLNGKQLKFKPGEKVMYSNLDYMLAGAAIEFVAGQSAKKYVDEHIFRPVMMLNTGYERMNYNVGSNAPASNKPHAESSRSARNAETPVPFIGDQIYSTSEDLYRWDRALYTENILSKESIDQMFKPYRDGQGFGWKIVKEFDRRSALQSSESFEFSASIRRYLDDGACVIVLTNMQSVDASKVSHDLGAILFDKAYELPRKPLD